MAAYNAVARFLLSDTGTPATSADDTGNGNTVTANYGTAEAAWTSNPAGNGWDQLSLTSGAGLFLQDITATGNLVAQLDGAKELSMLFRIKLDAGNSNVGRMFAITAGGNNGDVALCADDNGHAIIRWNNSDGVRVPVSILAALKTIAVKINTAEGAASDRVKVHFNGSATAETGLIGTYPTLNEAISINSTDRDLCIMNREAGARACDGQAFYAEIGTGLLTTAQIADSHTAIASNNDADWASAPPATPSLDDVNTDEIVLDDQTSNTLTVSNFTSDITSIKLKSGTAVTMALNLAGTGDSYTFDLPDITQYTVNTVGCPLGAITFEVADGTDTKTLAGNYDVKSGYTVVTVASAVTTSNSLFYGISAPADGSLIYIKTADNTVAQATGEYNTDSATNFTVHLWDIADDTWKQIDVIIEAEASTSNQHRRNMISSCTQDITQDITYDIGE